MTQAKEFPTEYDNQLRHKAKAELRKSMLQTRVLLSPLARAEKSRLIVGHVRALPAFERAQSIAIFLHITKKG
ncbi:MAG: hypothetical protein NVSMB1_16370 [Polyangiales bacterium]